MGSLFIASLLWIGIIAAIAGLITTKKRQIRWGNSPPSAHNSHQKLISPMEWLFFVALVFFIIVSIGGLVYHKKNKELNKKLEKLGE